MVDELDDGLAHLNDLDVTWGFGLDALLQERVQQAPAAGKAEDGAAETLDSSQGGVVDASSAPIRRTETAETMSSSQRGTVDSSSAPAGRAEKDPGAVSASNTGEGNDEDPPAVLSGRPTRELSSWERLPSIVRGRTRSQCQRLEGEPAVHQLRMNPEATDALLAAAYEWRSKVESILKGTSWTMEDAVALMVGGPAVENKVELSVCMPSVSRKA